MENRKDVAQGIFQGLRLYPYIRTQAILQTLSISKNDTYGIVLPGGTILVELIFQIALAAGPIEKFSSRTAEQAQLSKQY